MARVTIKGMGRQGQRVREEQKHICEHTQRTYELNS